jgi:hypothetical protein
MTPKPSPVEDQDCRDIRNQRIGHELSITEVMKKTERTNLRCKLLRRLDA